MTIPAHKQEELDRITEELDAQVVCQQGWTRGELSKAFDRLTASMDNWKEPIRTVVEAKDYDKARESVLFFCGCELIIVATTEGLDGRIFHQVVAEGYYSAIGA